MTEEGYYTNNISLECCAYRHKEETQICELERMSIIGTAKTSTSLSMPTRSPKVQSTIDKMVMIGKTLTAEQSNLIKDLIVRWVCGRDLRRTPIPDYDSDGVGVGVGASNKEIFGVRVGIGFSEKNFSESEL
jgi:hypothetical protein